MSELVPLAMFVSRRAVCPGCGAPLALEGQPAAVQCPFCGITAVIERRLRLNDPDLPPDRRRVVFDWTPSHLIDGQAQERIACWGCGAALTFTVIQGIVRCEHCGSESKVERRLRRLDLDIPRPEDEDRHTLSLIHRLQTSTDLAERVTLAKESFNGWQHINRTLARHVGEFMEIMRTCDPRLAHAIGEALGKLLCEGDVLLRDGVVRAAERFICDVQGSRSLLWQIGLGSGVCLKPLLEAADVAWQRGALEYCCAALWAANTLLGRNYPEHPIIAQIVLYRLLYVKGPVLYWALGFAKGEGVVAYRYSAETLLRFIDDCAAERPMLVPEIARCIDCDEIKNETDFRARLDLFRELQSLEAKDVLLRVLPAPPRGVSLRLLNDALGLLQPLLDTKLAASAHVALAKLKGTVAPPPSRREEPDPELVEAERLYREGIGAAVDTYHREAEALQHYWEIIKDRSPAMIAASRGEVIDADPNEQNSYGRTSLMFAAEAGQAQAVAELRRRGADPALRDQDGHTALMLAANAETISALLDADPSLLQEAYRAAFFAQRTDVLRVLLEAGVDPDTLEEHGATPLMLAVKAGWVEGLALLLEHGARTEHRDHDGKSVFDYATPEMATWIVRRMT